MPRTYETNILNYTGYEHEKYVSQLMQVSFTKPADYYKLQLEVMAYILEEHQKDIYQTIYQLLLKGLKKDGATRVINKAAYADTLDAMGIEWNPAMPDQEADKIAKQVVDGFASDIKKLVIDKVLPRNIFDEALKRSAKKAESNYQ